MKWRMKRRKDPEIAPDEIFLDASNAPAFDRARFEGRLEKPLTHGTFFYFTAVLIVLFLVLIIRTGGLQIIGYVSYPKKDAKGIYYDTTETGIAGLELTYDQLLAGENGNILTEVDAFGNVHSEGTIIKAEEGKTLRLSIDADLERLFERAIRDTASSQRFIAGAGVIMDVHTGAVRAIVSYPSYDPNVMSNGGPPDIIARYSEDPGRPFLDHAVQGIYAPGSIVKPFVAFGALTDGIISPNTIIQDNGAISLPDPYNPGKYFVYKGWKELGPMDVRSAQ